MDKKRLKHEIRERERAAERAAMPISGEAAEALFEHLGANDGERGCDHTLRRAREWIARQGYDAAPIVAWLEDHGGYCDCEVLYNVAPRVEDWFDGISRADAN